MNCLKHQILPILACVLLFSCAQDHEPAIDNQHSDAVELTGIETVIGNMVSSRANDNGVVVKKRTTGYIGREVFVGNDKMTITKFQRTEAPIADYSYNALAFESNNDGAWNRTSADPERIYWTDNANHHTIIGYSCPQAWYTGDGEQKTLSEDKWKSNQEGDNVNYFGQFNHTEGVVDFSDSTKIVNEDLLLTYSDEMQCEPGGYVAKLHYKHALASVKVVVNIMNFAPDENSQDAKTLVSDLKLLNQPWKYKWAQIPVDGQDGIKYPGWGVQKLSPSADEIQGVTVKTWLRDAAGIGTGRNKTFTFKSLVVPGKQDEFEMEFKVKYPKAIDPSQTEEKTYSAKLKPTAGVFFEPGKTTTINISLNHANEEITIGAEYIDWENAETPDQTNLSKYSTFLSTTERSAVTIADDAKATIEDATWLYKDKNKENKLVDIYGNDGSAERPFVIKTALQFLSFAYEVKNGREFSGLNIKLDASLVLQSDTEPSDDSSLDKWAKTSWIGIGDDSHPFNGTFIGTTRYVRYLKGAPLFNNIGENGKVCGLTLENVLGVTSGGMLAGTNAGTICACIANINTTNSFSAFSGLCGKNTGSIVACGTIGPDNAAEATAGICSTNSGNIIACYSGIKSKAGVAATNSGNITGCYYDSDKASGSATDGSVGKTTEEMQLKSFVTTLNVVLDNCSDEHFKSHRFQPRAAYYPGVN